MNSTKQRASIPTPAGHLALAMCLSLSACSDPESTDDSLESEPESESESESGSEPETSQRGKRICELFELIIIDDHLGIDVWNNGDFHDCPDDYLAAVDRTRYAVGGPRWRSVDAIEIIDGAGEPAEFDPEIVEIPAGLGHDMFRAAQVPLVPLAGLEQTLGVTIESVDDVPPEVQQMVRDSTVTGRDYQIVEVYRATPTQMLHRAGQEVFVLDDGQCRYAMKYYTSVVDPSITHEGALVDLGDRLPNLPEGWSFQVLTFDEDLVISETEGIAIVVSDELGNSYDRYECD